MTKQTQGARLIRALKTRPHTYMEMLALGISVAPWMRVRESLPEGWRIVKGRRWLGGKRYLTTWACKRLTNPEQCV